MNMKNVRLAALVVSVLSVGSCTNGNLIPVTVDTPLEFTVEIDENGAFDNTTPIPYDDIDLEIPDFDPHWLARVPLRIGVRSVSVTWTPDASSTAERVDFVVTSSYGNLSGANALTGLRSTVSSENISLDTDGNGLRELRAHLERKFTPSLTNPYEPTEEVGVRGTVSGGRASGSLKVTLALTVTAPKCQKVVGIAELSLADCYTSQ